MSDLTDADQLADVFASFAVSKNPTGLSLGIDSAYELGDHIASTWLAEHDAKVRAEEREGIASALIGPQGNLDLTVRAFKVGWHHADSLGRAGERVAEGLRMVVADRIEREAGLK